MWEKISATVYREFSDLGDIEDLTRLIVRLSLAVILAGVVGYERERRGSSAGLRTHMMVGLGVALLIVAAEHSGMGPEEVSRVIQGVFAGIGFLGAGAILKLSGDQVHGLTTAASLWATAAIATAAGLGRDTTAIVATIFAFVILSILKRVEVRKVHPGPADGPSRIPTGGGGTSDP
jgi:putative Mg2+ transporter-C (MgtC) family protein